MRIASVKIWIGLVAVSLFFAGASYAAIDPADIAGLWLFEEGSGTTAADSSGNGNDGELNGDPQWAAGKFGGGLVFDGDDFVSVPDSDSLDMTDAITLMCWFETDKVMVEFGDRMCAFGKHYLEYELGIYTDGAVHTYTNDGTGGGYDEGINTANAEAIWTVDQWYHVAWTLDGVHESVYIDGVLVGEFDKPNVGTLPGDNPLEIGQRVGGSLPFEGTIDEVVVINAVLSEADIVGAMNSGLAAVVNQTAVSASDKLATTWATIKAR